MVRVYFEELNDRLLLPIVHSFGDNRAFNKNVPYIKSALSSIQNETFVERVNDPNEADFFVFPHHFYGPKSVPDEYLERLFGLCDKHKKKIIFFLFGDMPRYPDTSYAVTFQCSANKSELKYNGYSLPPIVEDLLNSEEIDVRRIEEKPTVGFVGWARFENSIHALKTYLKDFFFCAWSFLLLKKNIGMRRKGIFLRRQLISLFQYEDRVNINFLIRDRYLGNKHGKTDDELRQTRKEYIENIINSDVTLAPRGDGNFSQRFYEVLSLGRIPLLIDTDIALPLEDVIPYDRFVIRVPYADRKNAVEYVLKFFEGLDDEEYAKRQREARHYFEKYLSLKGYYTYMFKEEHIFDYVEKQSVKTMKNGIDAV